LIPSRGLLHGFKIRNRFFGWDSLTLLRSVLILIKVSFHPFKDRYTFFFLLLDNRQTDTHTPTQSKNEGRKGAGHRERGERIDDEDFYFRILLQVSNFLPSCFLFDVRGSFRSPGLEGGGGAGGGGGGVEEGKRCLALPWVRAQGSLYEGSLHHLKKEEEK